MVSTRTYSTEVLCLKAKPYSDTSLLVWWLSPETGLISGMAKGARKANSRLVAGCQPLHRGMGYFAKGRSLDVLTQWDPQGGFSQVSKHLSGGALSACLIESTLRLAGGHESIESGSLFHPLVETLAHLQELCSPQSQVYEDTFASITLALLAQTVAGHLELLDAAGHGLQLTTCVVTDEPLPIELPTEAVIALSFPQGGVLHPVHAIGQPYSLRITAPTWRVLLNPLEPSVWQQHPQPLAPLRLMITAVAMIMERPTDSPALSVALPLLEASLDVEQRLSNPLPRTVLQ
ncbi:MAG: recombination protein O N-terminal domain-containing protein [Vampirovibrionales bacterium]|nr:recombination protein O N-terminal domain-containing protein [Vampirovibrionales bacterium]